MMCPDRACLKRDTVLVVQSHELTFTYSALETPPPLYLQVKEAAYHQLQVATGDLKKSLKNCSEEAGRIVRSIGEFVAVQDVLKSIHKVAHPEHERRTPPTVYTQQSGTKPHYLLNHSQLSSTPIPISLACSLSPMSSLSHRSWMLSCSTRPCDSYKIIHSSWIVHIITGPGSHGVLKNIPQFSQEKERAAVEGKSEERKISADFKWFKDEVVNKMRRSSLNESGRRSPPTVYTASGCAPHGILKNTPRSSNEVDRESGRGVADGIMSNFIHSSSSTYYT